MRTWKIGTFLAEEFVHTKAPIDVPVSQFEQLLVLDRLQRVRSFVATDADTLARATKEVLSWFIEVLSWFVPTHSLKKGSTCNGIMRQHQVWYEAC